jgi:uncharacterized protein YndB with AHSA1/START domain
LHHNGFQDHLHRPLGHPSGPVKDIAAAAAYDCEVARLNQYSFRTEWTFAAPIQRTFDVVTDLRSYPGIWRDFPRVRLVRGDGRAAGSAFECETRGSLPYTLRYTLEVLRTEEPRLILLRSYGDLVGTGRWDFAAIDAGHTSAVYSWDVGTTRPILNLVAPLARTRLARNHDEVMARGFLALRPRVEAVL